MAAVLGGSCIDRGPNRAELCVRRRRVRTVSTRVRQRRPTKLSWTYSKMVLCAHRTVATSLEGAAEASVANRQPAPVWTALAPAGPRSRASLCSCDGSGAAATADTAGNHVGPTLRPVGVVGSLTQLALALPDDVQSLHASPLCTTD